MLTTPRAILFGLGLIAVAIVIQPMARNAFISPAHAEMSILDLVGIENELKRIAGAISGIEACRG
jgi:hypothetical protein